MMELEKDQRYIAFPLCKGFKADDVVLTSCLEGNLGRVWVDHFSEPKVAVVVGADFCFLFGDTNAIQVVNLKAHLHEHAQRKVIVCSSDWGQLIEQQFPNEHKKFKRYAVRISSFNDTDLRQFTNNIDEKFTIKKIDKALYYKALQRNWTEDFCSFYKSYDDFEANGLGYVIIDNDEIVAGASSYTYCKGKIDITIGTLEEYRRQRLALACASKLILECLNRNILPQWDAANLQSVALAEKLGYQFVQEYTVYSI